jgi:lysine-specific demethylase 8
MHTEQTSPDTGPRLAPSVPRFDPIPRVRAPDRATFERDYLRPGKPAVFTGALDEWPGLGTWSLESLADRFASLDLLSVPLREGTVDVGEGRRGGFERISFGQHLADLRNHRKTGHYVSAPLTALPPALRADIVTPPYCEGRAWLRCRFWIGQTGTVTPLHHDLPHNFSAQVFGRKRWIIYAPSQRRALYPCPPWSRAPNFARTDPEAPDARRFPRFADARPMGCVLEPGEMLFVPSFWWHHVRALDDNGAVNFWFGDRLMALAGRASNALKRVRSIYAKEWE